MERFYAVAVTLHDEGIQMMHYIIVTNKKTFLKAVKGLHFVSLGSVKGENEGARRRGAHRLLAEAQC